MTPICPYSITPVLHYFITPSYHLSITRERTVFSTVSYFSDLL